MGDPAAGRQVVISQLDYRDERSVSEFYQYVLLPNFPASELVTRESFDEGLHKGLSGALVARLGDGAVVGGTVCDWFSPSRVLLLSYLAVQAGHRDLGIGRQLLETSLSTWAAEFRPLLVVAEVEDPRHYHGTAFGDPARRVRFYERIGARALPLPYFQPALEPGGERAEHLMLMVLGGSQAPPGARQVDGELVGRFLTDYLEQAEGQADPADAQARALLAACHQPGGLALLSPGTLPPE